MDTHQMKKANDGENGNGGALEKAKKQMLSPSVMVGNMLAKYQSEIKQALPSVMTPERFTRIAVNTVARDPKMIQAVQEHPKSFVGALMTCAQLGIEPNTPLGQGYLLPYRNFDKNTGKKVMMTNFQLGYQGVIDLCYRSGEMKTIQAKVVYENDFFEYEFGLHPVCKHKPALMNRGKPIAYYASFTTKNGGEGFDVMSYEDVYNHAKRFSKTYNAESDSFSGPWGSDFDSMAKKTVLLQALKYAPKKSEFARAISAEGSTKSQILADMSEAQNEAPIDITDEGSASGAPYDEGKKEAADAEKPESAKKGAASSAAQSGDAKKGQKQVVEDDLGFDAEDVQ